MKPDQGRFRLPSFWNFIFIFTVCAALIAMGTLLFSPGRALAQQALPVSLRSDLQANYSADEVTFLLPPVQLRLAEEAAQDRLARYERPLEPTLPISEIIKTPVPKTTDKPLLKGTSTSVSVPTRTEPLSSPTRLPTKQVVVVLKPSSTRTPAPTKTGEPSLTPLPPSKTPAPVIVQPTSTFTKAPVIASPTRTPTKRPTRIILLPTKTPTRTLIWLPTKTASSSLKPTFTPTPTKTLLEPPKISSTTPSKTPSKTVTPTPIKK